MKIFEKIDLLKRLDQLFRLKATGTSYQLAEKLELSDRQVRRIVEELKEVGLPIEYCKKRQTYYYKETVMIKFEISVIKNDEVSKLVGGETRAYNFFDNFFSNGQKMSISPCNFVSS